jgi:hypothetical protein
MDFFRDPQTNSIINTNMSEHKMAQPSTRQELIDYCKRKLGAPVLEINVADEQIEDL